MRFFSVFSYGYGFNCEFHDLYWYYISSFIINIQQKTSSLWVYFQMQTQRILARSRRSESKLGLDIKKLDSVSALSLLENSWANRSARSASQSRASLSRKRKVADRRREVAPMRCIWAGRPAWSPSMTTCTRKSSG